MPVEGKEHYTFTKWGFSTGVLRISIPVLCASASQKVGTFALVSTPLMLSKGNKDLT